MLTSGSQTRPRRGTATSAPQAAGECRVCDETGTTVRSSISRLRRPPWRAGLAHECSIEGTEPTGGEESLEEHRPNDVQCGREKGKLGVRLVAVLPALCQHAGKKPEPQLMLECPDRVISDNAARYARHRPQTGTIITAAPQQYVARWRNRGSCRPAPPCRAWPAGTGRPDQCHASGTTDGNTLF